MGNLIKKPYELSLWEDRLVSVTPSGEYEGKVPASAGKVILQYYKEYKIAILGSDSMTSPIKAFNSTLKRNINGTSTLTFSIYSHYYDEDSGELLDNPFKKMVINERKIKLRYGAPNDCEWYDFVVKNISEDSESKIFTYTAKDLFVNELSKTGFNLEFNQDLENNIGTINELAEKVLSGSDWKLGRSQVNLEQTKEEPVYKILIPFEAQANNVKKEQPGIKIKQDSIYVFYSVIENREEYFQFLFVPNKEYKLDDRKVVINNNCNYFWNVTYDAQDNIFLNGQKIANIKDLAICSDKRGKKFVRKQLTKYDSSIDKYVKVFTRNIPGGTEDVYGFTEHEYLSSNMVKSFVTNPNNFANCSGWKGCTELRGVNESIPPDMEPTLVPSEINIAMVPDIRDVGDSYTGEYCSYLKYIGASNQALYNSGILDNRAEINGFTKDQKYVFRIKYGQVTGSYVSGRPSSLGNSTTGFSIKIAPYIQKDGIYSIKDPLFQGQIKSPNGSLKNYQTLELVCQYSMSYSEMLSIENQIGIFLQFNGSGTFYISDMQFFKYYEDEHGQLCLPNEPIKSTIKTKYYYYLPNDKYEKIEDVNYLYEENIEAPSSMFAPKFNTNSFEKIRTIDISESNRFNLIQTLCETFQCWARFDIEHEPNGSIKLDENYRQKKWVTFYEAITKQNDCGFRYGINLKAIKREVESEGIVSKIIVKNNANEFAKDGFCSIARAEENYARENFILDFSYFIQQGLLDFNQINNDLYANKDNLNGYLGYYKQLRALNIESQDIISEQSLLATDIIKFEAKVQFFRNQVEQTESQKGAVSLEIKKITGRTYEQLLNDRANSWWDNDEIIAKAHLIKNYENTLAVQRRLLDNTEAQLEDSQRIYKGNKDTLQKNIDEKILLDEKFFKKYSRFIQEGSWISEDYIDDNLYYLDAESTLHTSSQPKVSYTINVLELSALEEYSNYHFSLGDKSFIEDTKFFGWTYKDGVKTPYKEEIVVTEINISLDSPELNTVIVQNYKTQFEDLFQRITATTQSLEFSTGQYNKVSNIIESNGEIKFDTLQNTIANNSFVIQNSKNQSVIWDDTGITTTSLESPNEVVRIVSGGIFISEDGGIKWNTGITGKGINANCITTGQLNTNQINILNGAYPSFRWDSTGLNAYRFETDQNSKTPQNFSYGKFVRFDQYGLYGINGDSKFDANIAEKDGQKTIVGEDKIWKYANFALTWKGFQIKSKHEKGGYVSITSENDIEVKNNQDKTQVKIGLLNPESNDQSIYGLRLSDSEGKTVLEQSSEGKIWIRDSLNISAPLKYDVKIGNLPGIKPKKDSQESSDIHEVFNANNKFKVYEDGSMYASSGHFEGSGKFEGEIIATSGRIGNVTIGDIEGSVTEMSKITILQQKGDTFKVSADGSSNPTGLSIELKLTNVVLPEGATPKWFYSKNFTDWHEKTFLGQNLFKPTLLYVKEDFSTGVYYLKVQCTSKEGKLYEAYCTFYSVSDGASAADEPRLEIFSSSGDYMLDEENITLTAKILKGEKDITSQYAASSFVWKKFFSNGTEDAGWAEKKKKKGEITGNIAIITNLDIEQKAIFDCSLSLN